MTKKDFIQRYAPKDRIARCEWINSLEALLASERAAERNKERETTKLVFNSFVECRDSLGMFECRHYRRARAIVHDEPFAVVNGRTFWTIEECQEAGMLDQVFLRKPI